MIEEESMIGGESVVTLTISRVKDEHVLHTVKMIVACGDKLEEDGTDIGIDFSVERNRDGKERIHEYLGEILKERGEL